MNRLWVSGAAALALGIAACAGEDGAKGRDAGPCSVAVTEGRATISCPDGTITTLDPGACTVTSGGGSHTITCPDGSTTVIRDGEQLPRAAITGTVAPYGLPPRAIEVTLVQEDRTVTTDDTGLFAIDDVAPGLYDLRLSTPGYATLDIRNVAVLGADVDIGPRTIKLGRWLDSGISSVAASPSGAKLAVSRGALFEDYGPLSLVDTATGETRELTDEAGSVAFIGEDYVVTDRPIGFRHETVVFDLSADTDLHLPGVDTWWPLESALAYGEGGMLQLLPLQTMAQVTLGAGSLVWADGRDALVQLASGVLLRVDGATAEVVQIANHAFDWRVHEQTKQVAVIDQDEDGTYVLKRFTPGETAPVRIGETVINAAYHWSEDGSLLVFPTPEGGFRIADANGIAALELPANVFDVVFSPSGRYLLARGGTESPVIDRVTGNRWTLPGGNHGFTRDDRYAYAYANGTGLLLVDLQGAAGVVVPHEMSVYGVEALAGDVLLVTGEDGLASFDASTGTRTRFTAAAGWTLSPDARRVFFTEPATGALSFFDATTGAVTSLDLTGEPGEWSNDGRWLFVRGGNGEMQGDMTLVSADGATVLPVDEKILDAEDFDAGFAYWAGDFTLLPLAFDTSDLFGDVDLYWVAYP